MSDWIKSDQKLGKWKAIRHKLTGELCLSGKYGEIWIKNSIPGFLFQNKVTYSAMLRAPLRSKLELISDRSGSFKSLKKGDEIVFSFDSSQLDEVAKALRIYKEYEPQILAANSY